MFNQTDLEAFVGGLLAKKRYTSFSEAEQNTIKEDLLDRLVAQLEIALTDALPEDKVAELTAKLQAGDMSDDEIGQFLRENNVNIEEITSKTKDQFEKFFMMETPVAAKAGVREKN